ncbi:hypothetical protein [Clostridium sp. Cult1]|uniref:hypothetical protein n=1 Tax=Clostridium sp. Cult1 TaxID=2079002 RepID=UPI001F49237C|nr:hypothetical protein [Clostridium sp. Cult1]
MYKKMKIHKTKRNVLAILIVALLLFGCILWYRELGTNREVPKKAKFVINSIMRGDSYR